MKPQGTAPRNAYLPELVLNAEFNDMGRYGEAVAWDLDFRQIEPGQLKARARMVAARDCQVLFVHFNRAFHQVGESPRDRFTFGLTGNQLAEFRWCDRRAAAGTLLNFNLDAGFDSRTARNFNGVTISFERDRLRQLADLMGLSGTLGSLVQRGVVWNSKWGHLLGKKLAYQLNALGNGEHLGGAADFFNEELGISILRILAGNNVKARAETRSQRQQALKRSLDFLSDSENLPIGVVELSKRVGTSLSTLERSFTDAFGVSPKAYIKMRCLSAVRDELATSDPGSRVAAVANRWGFWHMGQFAADYRRAFGELPSATLAR